MVLITNYSKVFANININVSPTVVDEMSMRRCAGPAMPRPAFAQASPRCASFRNVCILTDQRFRMDISVSSVPFLAVSTKTFDSDLSSFVRATTVRRRRVLVKSGGKHSSSSFNEGQRGGTEKSQVDSTSSSAVKGLSDKSGRDGATSGRRLEEEIHEVRMEKLALEKALESATIQISRLTADVSIAKKQAAAAIAERDEAFRRVAQVEEEEKMAEHDAKEALHREMEALAELERMAEMVEVLRQELAHAKRRKAGADHDMQQNSTGSMSEEEMTIKVSQANAAVVKANLMAEEAQQRAFEIRAEAALLVETVEDRAVEAVQAAQAEVAKLKAELERRGG